MSIADRVRLSYVAESVFGTPPASTLVDLRFVSESLTKAIQTGRSAEIRQDRQTADLIRRDVMASGDVAFELSYGTLDPFIQAALFSTAWPSETVILAKTGNKTITTTTATGNVQVTSGFGSVVAGDLIRFNNMTGALASMDGKTYKVLSVTDSSNIIVAGAEALPAGTQAASLTANGAITKGSSIVNGTTLTSFAFEKKLTDLSNYFLRYNGMVVDQLSLAIAAEQIVTGSMSLLGVNETAAAATFGSGYTAANTNQVMNAIEDVYSVIEGTPAVNADNRFEVTDFSLAIANNLRARKIVGGSGPDSFGYGKFSLTGSMTAYFESQAAATKFLAFTESSIMVLLKDSSGNSYVIEIPKLNYTAGPRVTGGENTDIMLPLSFEAFRDPTLDATVRITRWAAFVP